METTTNPTAKRFTENDEWDELSSFDEVLVAGRDLRAGMMLIDDLGCPVMWLDRRTKAEFPHCITFWAWREDGEVVGARDGRFVKVTVSANSKVSVAA
jgi:hypothetical protein